MQFIGKQKIVETPTKEKLVQTPKVGETSEGSASKAKHPRKRKLSLVEAGSSSEHRRKSTPAKSPKQSSGHSASEAECPRKRKHSEEQSSSQHKESENPSVLTLLRSSKTESSPARQRADTEDSNGSFEKRMVEIFGEDSEDEKSEREVTIVEKSKPTSQSGKPLQ